MVTDTPFQILILGLELSWELRGQAGQAMSNACLTWDIRIAHCISEHDMRLRNSVKSKHRVMEDDTLGPRVKGQDMSFRVEFSLGGFSHLRRYFGSVSDRPHRVLSARTGPS